jgi:hypothetical protein
MTTFTNALRYIDAATHKQPGPRAWAPDAAAEQSVLFAGIMVFFVGACAVVGHALSAGLAFN